MLWWHLGSFGCHQMIDLLPGSFVEVNMANHSGLPTHRDLEVFCLVRIAVIEPVLVLTVRVARPMPWQPAQ
jgi:hypothetical protein